MQVAGLISCSVLLVVLLAFAPLFHDLPKVNLCEVRSLFLNIKYNSLMVCVREETQDIACSPCTFGAEVLLRLILNFNSKSVVNFLLNELAVPIL